MFSISPDRWADVVWPGIAGIAFLAIILMGWVAARKPKGMPLAYALFQAFIWCVGRWRHSMTIEGEFNIPEGQGCLVVANHSCGGDPPYLIAACPRRLSFLVAKEVHALWWVRPLTSALHCIPVNRNGTDTAAVRQAIKKLKQGRWLVIFPQGAMKMDHLGEGKPGTAMIAYQTDAPIVPVYIHGTYPSENLIEPLFKPANVTLFVGEPFTLPPKESFSSNKERLKKGAAIIMAAIGEQRARAYSKLGEDKLASDFPQEGACSKLHESLGN